METSHYFRDKLMDHYLHPRHAGTLNSPDFESAEYNHSCGDQIHIQGRVEHDVLVEVGFTGSGCILSQAAASMIMESCANKSVAQILVLNGEYVQNLLGVDLGPTRLRCALLPLYALQHGLSEYMKKLAEAR